LLKQDGGSYSRHDGSAYTRQDGGSNTRQDGSSYPRQDGGSFLRQDGGYFSRPPTFDPAVLPNVPRYSMIGMFRIGMFLCFGDSLSILLQKFCDKIKSFSKYYSVYALATVSLIW
jgi:hypothetical protein